MAAFKQMILLKDNIVPLRFNYVYPHGDCFYYEDYAKFMRNGYKFSVSIYDKEDQRSIEPGNSLFVIDKIKCNKIVGSLYFSEPFIEVNEQIIVKICDLLNSNNHEEHLFVDDHLQIILHSKSFQFIEQERPKFKLSFEPFR